MTDYASKEPIKGIWKFWAISTLLFLAWAVLYFLTSYLMPRPESMPAAAIKYQLIILLINSVIYAALTPALLLFAIKFPVERGMLRERLPLYGAAALLFVVIHAGARLIVYPMRTANGNFLYHVSWLGFERLFLAFVVDDVFSTCLPAIAIAHAVVHYRRGKEKEVRSSQLQAALVESQLRALKGQIHPHFLFNTMHSISALMHIDVAAADTMMCRLSHLLRITLETSALQESTLREELDFLECYLKIEETRFQDRMKVIFDIDPDVMEAQVPHLLLEPLVENALHHGISRMVANGEIQIIAERKGATLRISIEDNGPGFSGQPIAEKQPGEVKHSGLGLKITTERLSNLYGTEHKFKIERSRSGGTKVNIEIPFKMGVVFDSQIETELVT